MIREAPGGAEHASRRYGPGPSPAGANGRAAQRYFLIVFRGHFLYIPFLKQTVNMAFLNDITLGQYYPADSFLHRLDPRSKLFAAFSLMSGCY